MKKNMGTADRAIRIMAALVIVLLYMLGAINGALATVLLIVAGIFIFTGFVSFCPLYLTFGISTRKKTK